MVLTVDFLRSQSTNFGKNTTRSTKKGPFGLINRTFKFISSHNENTQVSEMKV